MAIEPVSRRRRGSNLVGIVAAVSLAVVVVIAILFAVLDDDSEGPETGATVSAIADEPESFLGRQVTVSGEVREQLGAGRFTIGEDDRVLVVPRRGIVLDEEGLFDDGQTVAVTGVVRAFDVGVFENEVGGGFDEGVFGDFVGRPAVVAASVRPLPEEQ